MRRANWCPECRKEPTNGRMCDGCKARRRFMAFIRRRQLRNRKPEDWPVIRQRVKLYAAVHGLGIALFE